MIGSCDMEDIWGKQRPTDSETQTSQRLNQRNKKKFQNYKKAARAKVSRKDQLAIARGKKKDTRGNVIPAANICNVVDVATTSRSAPSTQSARKLNCVHFVQPLS